MLIVGFLQWWYSQGWIELIHRSTTRIRLVLAAFSVGQILKTLFSPWKQIVAYKDPNATIGDKFRGLIDNLVSRTIGFFVRIFTLLAALIIVILTSFTVVIAIIVWPFLPIASLALIIKGIGLV